MTIELDQVAKKFVHFAEEIEVKTLKREPEIVEVEIDEKKMDRLLHLLHEADPESDATDPQAIVELEGMNLMNKNFNNSHCLI